MTYQQPFDPQQPPQHGPPAQYGQLPVSGQPYSAPPPDYPPTAPPAAPKKTNTTKIVLGVVGGVLVLCCGGVGIAAIAGGGSKPHSAERRPASGRTQEKVAAAPATSTTTRPSTPTPLSPVEAEKPVAMPDVRGQNAAVAEDYLRNLGFTQIKFGSQDDLDSWVVLPQNWTVKKQSTKPGRKIPTDTLIVLTCTKLD